MPHNPNSIMSVWACACMHMLTHICMQADVNATYKDT